MGLKALTIIEIIVTLAISTFIIMIAMMVYLVVNKQISEYKRINEECQRIYELQFLLQKDVNEANYVSFDKINNSIHFTGDVKNKYSLHEAYIIRTSGTMKDTFQFHSSTLEPIYNEQTNEDTLPQTLVFEIIPKISGMSCFYHYSIDYSSEIYLKDREGKKK